MNSSPLVILYFYKCSFLDALSVFPVWINYLFANLYLLLNRWDRKKLGQPRQDELSSMIRRMDQEEEKERLHKENILLFVAAPKIPWCHKLFMIIYSHFSKTLQRKWGLKETNSSHIIAEHCWCGCESKWIFLTQFIFIGPRYTWAPIKDTNSILTDAANRAIKGNGTMQVSPPGCQNWNQCKWRHLVAKFLVIGKSQTKWQ